MRRIPALLSALAVAAFGPVAVARADGDPASDVLLSQDVFTPYAPNTVSKPVKAALDETVKRAKQEGFPVKVALVADRRDLGSAGQLIGEPQKYADLLTQELSLNVNHGSGLTSPRVLVVLPAGLGGNELGDNAGTALEDVLPDPAEGADGLARTAAVAVGKLAAADGKAITLPALPAASAAPADGGGGGVPGFVLFGAPVLVVLLVVVGLNARAGSPPDAEPAPVPGDAPAAG